MKLFPSSAPYKNILEFLITPPIELQSLRMDEDAFSVERRTIVEMELEGKRKESEGLEKVWVEGRERLRI